MQTWILWILALYGLTLCFVRIMAWLHYPLEKKAVHYCIYTCNSQGKIEWVIRSLNHYAKIEGRPFYFYIQDTGSNDDTLEIIERLNRTGIEVSKLDPVAEQIDGLNEQMIVRIDLRRGASLASSEPFENSYRPT